MLTHEEMPTAKFTITYNSTLVATPKARIALIEDGLILGLLDLTTASKRYLLIRSNFEYSQYC